MRKVIAEIIEGFFQPKLENFNSQMKTLQIPQIKNPGFLLVSFIIVEFLVLLFGKYLWNTVVVKLFSGVKPVNTLWQILGLSIFIKMITN
jgi:hypothetical protein